VILSQILISFVVYAETAPVANPILPQNCGLDLVLVIDQSGSIDTDEIQQEKDAFLALVDDLSGTPTEFAVVSFNTTALMRQGFTINPALAKSAINSVAYAYNTATNWQDALIKAKSVLPNQDYKQNLIVFASDGNPTVNNENFATGLVTDNNDLENAIVAANDVKQTYNTRIVTLGIGEAVNEANLRKISGNLAGDHYNVADFEELKTALHNLAAGMCGGTVTVTKKIGVENNWINAGNNWIFNIGGQTASTDVDGKTPATKLTNGTYEISETPQNDYSLVNASCVVTNNGGV